MTVIHRHADTSATPTTETTQTPTTLGRRALALLRIGFGLTFLWAFFDKLLALGFHTGYDQEGNLDRFGDAAWINGASPTEGFLKFGADGPFKGFYNSIGGTVWADWLFMLGLLGIGLALTLGIGMRIAATAGARPVRPDVDRRAAPREQPGDRRPHPRRHHAWSSSPPTTPATPGASAAPGPGPSWSRTTPSSGDGELERATAPGLRSGGRPLCRGLEWWIARVWCRRSATQRMRHSAPHRRTGPGHPRATRILAIRSARRQGSRTCRHPIRTVRCPWTAESTSRSRLSQRSRVHSCPRRPSSSTRVSHCAYSTSRTTPEPTRCRSAAGSR